MKLLHFIPLAALLAASSCEDLKLQSNSSSGDWRIPKDDKPDKNSEQSRWKVGQPVRTTSGTIIGHPALKRPEVSEYLGIRFAKPPVGNLRFAAPQPYRSDATFEAAAFSPDCPANVANAATIAPILGEIAVPQGLELFEELGQTGDTQSEDCLTLNIWTKPQVGAKKKAVMFWIFGGGFQFGTTNEKSYNGQYFADDDDVVLVSANYRTNIFGFPGLPDIWDAPQNPGLMDQRLAIEWVRDNIRAFGGDPKRITLFGQSAGAASVDVYQFAYTKDPIAHGFIQESGTARSFADPWPSDHISDWYNMSATVGCGGEEVSLHRSLRCVRTKPFQAILNATFIANPLQALLGIFTPTVDDKIVFGDYAARGLAGDFIQKPLLLGNTFYEAGLFKLLAQAGGQNLSDTQWALFNQAIFQCPSASATLARVLNGVPTWRYLYFGDFFNLALSFMPPSGAYHTAEIPVVFETIGDSVTVPSTPAELKISRYMNAVWASFAKNPQGALSDDPWFRLPQYDPLTPSLLLFAITDSPHPSVAPPILFDSLCPTLDAIGALTPGGLPGLVLAGESTTTASTDDGDIADRKKKLPKPSKKAGSAAAIMSGTDRLSKDPKLDAKARQYLDDYMAQLRGQVPLTRGVSPPHGFPDLPDGPMLDKEK